MSVPVLLSGILRTKKKKKNSEILHTATTCNGLTNTTLNHCHLTLIIFKSSGQIQFMQLSPPFEKTKKSCSSAN